MDKTGDTVDFLLTAKRDLAAARRYLERAIDKNDANTAAIKSVNADACLDIELRQSKSLNNLIEQDHRAVKRITNPMMDFTSFWSAQKLIAGIETLQMVKKGQLHGPGGKAMSAADQFYSLDF